ncbi:hypothetical protein BH11PSE4_BH11PSE4_24690 [soil metagenome]
MRKPLTKAWTDEECARLIDMVKAGASVSRCSAAFNRPTNSVRNQARRLGTPFPGSRATKAIKMAKINAAEKHLPPGAQRYDGSRV